MLRFRRAVRNDHVMIYWARVLHLFKQFDGRPRAERGGALGQISIEGHKCGGLRSASEV